MIIGAHSIIYSTNARADREFLRDVLGFPHVDAGGGWLIFGLPPAEVALHPHSRNDLHEFYLMCEDIRAFVAAMEARDVRCGPVKREVWGLLTEITLPGGGKLGVYQPRHARPPAMKARVARKTAPKAPGKTAPKAPRKAAPKAPGKTSAARGRNKTAGRRPAKRGSAKRATRRPT